MSKNGGLSMVDDDVKDLIAKVRELEKVAKALQELSMSLVELSISVVKLASRVDTLELQTKAVLIKLYPDGGIPNQWSAE